MIAGKWWVQLSGFHDLICLGAHANQPFDDGDLIKYSIEKVVQEKEN